MCVLATAALVRVAKTLDTRRHLLIRARLAAPTTGKAPGMRVPALDSATTGWYPYGQTCRNGCGR